MNNYFEKKVNVPYGSYVLRKRADGDKVKTLNKHFKNKANVPYGRYVLHVRTNVQRDKEIVNQFITRLRQQGVYCDFIKQDELIRDHAIEKNKSHKIRVKLLERGKT